MSGVKGKSFVEALMAENGVFSLSEVNAVAPVCGGLRRTPFDVRGKSILMLGS